MNKIKQVILISVIAGGMLSSLQASSSSSAGDINQAIVIDNGSSTIRAGFAGDGAPRSVFPSVVGRPRHRAINIGTKDCYVGDEAQSKRGTLTIKHPVEAGIVTNWDDMEAIWQHTFAELKVDPAHHPVLLTEAPLNPKANREKTAQVMFETFNVLAMCLENSAVSSLYASGRTTGIVLESDSQVTLAVPIYEGHALHHATIRIGLGSNDLKYHLSKLCNEVGHSFVTNDSIHTCPIIQGVLENKCFVRMPVFDPYLRYQTTGNYGNGNVIEKPIEEKYKLPYGQVISLGEERWKVPEVLFNPSLMGREFLGIHQLTYNSISKVDPDLWKVMFGNIVLAGGNTMFPGLGERLSKEVNGLAPAGTKVQVIAPQNRKHSAYIGGAMLASLSTFNNLCVSQEEYNEYGPTIVHRKFF